MKDENTKYPEEKDMVMELLKNASYARRFYLVYDIIDRIFSLFTTDERQLDDSKWEKLILLQERINLVKNELGYDDYIDVMHEVIETISEYLNKNLVFKEEAIKNLKLFLNIRNEKENRLVQILSMEDDLL